MDELIVEFGYLEQLCNDLFGERHGVTLYINEMLQQTGYASRRVPGWSEAASKGENDIAMGNVVGSNIFNILFILGTATVIRPLEVSGGSFIDIAVLIFCSIVVCLLALPKKKLTRLSGLVMTVLYISYTLYIFM